MQSVRLSSHSEFSLDKTKLKIGFSPQEYESSAQVLAASFYHKNTRIGRGANQSLQRVHHNQAPKR